MLNFLGSEYSSSNWYHSNTPNSRHFFNTNMYKIHFYVKKHMSKPYSSKLCILSALSYLVVKKILGSIGVFITANKQNNDG